MTSGLHRLLGLLLLTHWFVVRASGKQDHWECALQHCFPCTIMENQLVSNFNMPLVRWGCCSCQDHTRNLKESVLAGMPDFSSHGNNGLLTLACFYSTAAFYFVYFPVWWWHGTHSCIFQKADQMPILGSKSSTCEANSRTYLKHLNNFSWLDPFGLSHNEGDWYH